MAQMGGKDLCGGFVSEALSRLIVEVARHVVEQALRYDREVRIARQEAANAFVDVLDRALLPWRTRITEPTAGAEAVFQSPEASELAPAVEGEALTREGR